MVNLAMRVVVASFKESETPIARFGSSNHIGFQALSNDRRLHRTAYMLKLRQLGCGIRVQSHHPLSRSFQTVLSNNEPRFV